MVPCVSCVKMLISFLHFPSVVRTETICMFGIVPVKVKGTVNENDQLYASVSDPGVAVSEFNLRFKPSLANDSALIGVAWEAKKPGNEDEVCSLFHR